MFYILHMHHEHINHIDLNLLKALSALLETVSVSKAADAVNLSQPAMSRALNRLQHTLKDPLLVRSGRGMVLTPRGEALREPLRTALSGVSAVFQPAVFDPSKAQDRFRIIAPDYLTQMVLPGVVSQVLNLAPDIRIEIENLSAAGIEDMSEGRASLLFGVVEDGPELHNVRSQALLKDRQVCLMRRDHPLAKKYMTLDGFAAAPHALLSITGRGGGRIDDVLRNHGLSRNIALRITHFLTINSVIAPTDLIMTVPELLAQQVMTDQLTSRPLPKELRTPPFNMSQIWHERFSQDPAHQWLRRIIKAECQQLARPVSD